jgi:hypothetical protein
MANKEQKNVFLFLIISWLIMSFNNDLKMILKESSNEKKYDKKTIDWL